MVGGIGLAEIGNSGSSDDVGPDGMLVDVDDTGTAHPLEIIVGEASDCAGSDTGAESPKEAEEAVLSAVDTRSDVEIPAIALLSDVVENSDEVELVPRGRDVDLAV
jgi:hypothetical protein